MLKIFRIISLSIIFLGFLSFKNDSFATLVQGFSSDDLSFIPVSEANKKQYIEILKNPLCSPEPYVPFSEENATGQAELHVKDQLFTAPHAYLFKLTKSSGDIIGSAWCCAGRKYYDASKSFLDNLDTIGVDKDGRTELGWGKVRLLEEYQNLKPQIMDVLIGRAFDQVPAVKKIAFGVRGIKGRWLFGKIVLDRSGTEVSVEKFGMEYARSRKFSDSLPPIDKQKNSWEKMPYSPNEDEGYVYCFDIERDFFEKNRGLFVYYHP